MTVFFMMTPTTTKAILKSEAVRYFLHCFGNAGATGLAGVKLARALPRSYSSLVHFFAIITSKRPPTMAPSLLPKAAATAPPPTETTKRLYDLLDGKQSLQQQKKKQKVFSKAPTTNVPQNKTTTTTTTTTPSNAALPVKSTAAAASATTVSTAIAGGSFSSIVSKVAATAAAPKNRNVFGMHATLEAASTFRPASQKSAKENNRNSHLLKPKVKSLTSRKQKSNRNAKMIQDAKSDVAISNRSVAKSSAKHQVNALAKIKSSSQQSSSLHLNLLPSSSITQQRQQQPQKRIRSSMTRFAQLNIPESCQQQVVLPHPAAKSAISQQRAADAEEVAVIQTATGNTSASQPRASNNTTTEASLCNAAAAATTTATTTTTTSRDDDSSGSACSGEASPTAVAPRKVSSTTTTTTTTTFQPEQRRPSSAWQDIPRPLVLQNKEAISAFSSLGSSTSSSQSRKADQGNFVRLNLRNAAGACFGARNKKAKRKAALLRERQQQERYSKNQQEQQCNDDNETITNTRLLGNTVRPVSRTGVDPVDDYLDGVYTTATSTSSSNSSSSSNNSNKKKKKREDVIPKCSGHQRPCKLLTVKKTTSGNKGRPFYCCSFPRGEQCDYFEWADDTVEATRQALEKNTSPTGFVARQVASYMDRIKSLTVPELKTLAQKHGLSLTGKKQQLLTRLAIWVRDELSSTLPPTETNEHGGDEAVSFKKTAGVPTDKDRFSDDEDDSVSSSSDEELELFVDKDGDDDASVCESDDTQDDRTVEKGASVIRTNASCPVRSKLFTVFGHEDFRKGQEWAIRRCLEHKNSLLVAPTGFGKSLCYALPAALMSGVCIVVSPLLSLIQDQIRILPPRLPAATLSGQMTTASMAATVDDIIRGRIKILFVSPERLTSCSFRRMFRMKWNQETNQYERQFPTVSLLCVDEAHCLSQWGHNFRPSYLRISSMTQMIQPQSVLAITATAGPRVVSDICQALVIQRNDNLESSECGVRIMSTDRDNIDVKSFVLANQEKRLNKVSHVLSSLTPIHLTHFLLTLLRIQLLKILSPNKRKTFAKSTNVSDGRVEDGCLSTGSVIVYVWRQRDAEAVAENIQAAGVTGGVVVYHGGMEAAARTRAQSKVSKRNVWRTCIITSLLELTLWLSLVHEGQSSYLCCDRCFWTGNKQSRRCRHNSHVLVGFT